MVQFIAVNYFGATSLRPYIESLLAQDCPDWRLAVVDNSGCERELHALARLARLDARIEVCAAPENLGYFGGAWWWLSNRLDQLSDWTIVSNVDVQVRDATFLSRLRRLDGSASVVAPSIVALPSGCPKNPHLLTRPSVSTMRRARLAFLHPLVAQSTLLVEHLVERWRRHVPADPQPVYAPHGSFIPFHRRFFESGGTLEHPVFLFGEEMNVAEQCRRLGLVVGFEPSLRVYHLEHQSTRVLRTWRVLQAQVDAVRYCYHLIAPSAN